MEAPVEETSNNTCSTSGGSQISPTRASAAAAAPTGFANEADKPKLKKGKSSDLSMEFVSILSTRIEELEKCGTNSTPAEREVFKARRRQLKEVQKYCSERSHSLDDRLAFIQQRYQQLVSEVTRTDRQLLESHRELDSVVKERDRVQVELKKSNTLRDKLQELCRQLQREAREMAEESRRRSEVELKERLALQSKFSAAIDDVTVKMDQHQSERLKQLSENDALRGKLGEFLQQFELQQKHFTATLHAKDLELQLSAAKLEQQTQVAQQLTLKADLLQQNNSKLTESQEVIMKELNHAAAAQEHQGALAASNRELKSQLEHYHSRFEEFQGTLTKSNQMFVQLKGELESHSKARAVLTRERDEQRRKAVSSDAAVASLQEEKAALKDKIEKLTSRLSTPSGPDECARLLAQRDRLEGLCRTLQTQLKAAAAATAVPPASAPSEQRLSSTGGTDAGDVVAGSTTAGVGSEGVGSMTSGSDAGNANGGIAAGDVASAATVTPANVDAVAARLASADIAAAAAHGAAHGNGPVSVSEDGGAGAFAAGLASAPPPGGGDEPLGVVLGDETGCTQ